MKMQEPLEWELDCLTGHDIVVDPLMAQVVKEAKEYQRMIDAASKVTSEELDAILDDLNGRWPYHDQIVTVNGTLLTWLEMKSDDEDEEPGYSLQTQYVNETKFYSAGFSIIDQSETEDEHIWTIGYLFGQGERNERPAPFMDLTRAFSSFGLLDDVHMAGYSLSDEFAQTRAEYYLPKETQGLNERLFDAEDSQDFVHILSGMTLYPEKNEQTDGYNALIALVNNMFKVADSGLPSKISIKAGDYVKTMDESPPTIAIVDTSAVRYSYPSRLLLDNVFSIDNENQVNIDETRLVWCLEATVLASDGVWRQLIIPLDHIDHLEHLPPTV